MALRHALTIPGISAIPSRRILFDRALSLFSSSPLHPTSWVCGPLQALTSWTCPGYPLHVRRDDAANLKLGLAMCPNVP